MDYRLKHKDEINEITAEAPRDGALTVTIGEETKEVSYSKITDHQLSLNIGGKMVSAYVTGDSTNKSIVINGVAYDISDADAETSSRKKSGAAGSDLVTPLMPSVVVSVEVSEGDEVDKGQALVVLTAMKMESTLRAPYPGKVTKVSAKVGAKVMPGDILVDIEKSVDENEEGE